MNIIILVSICLAAIIKFSEQLPANPDERPDYNQCGETYQCFGMPDGCVGSLKCEVLLKTEVLDTGDVEFNLYWLKMATDSWVAAGISTDKDKPMNNASTAVFVLDDKNITVVLGLTHVDNNTGFTPMNTTGHTVEKKTYVNGLLRVQWRREVVTKIGNMTFDLKKTSYQVILARGPVKAGQIQSHTLKWASSMAYNFEKEPQVTTQTPSKSTPTQPSSKSTQTPTGSTGNSKHTETATWTTTTGNTTGTTGNSTGTSKTPLTSTSKPESTTQGKGSGSTISMSIVSAVFVSIVLLFN